MRTLSNDVVKVEFRTVDKTRAGLKSLQNGLDSTFDKVKRLNNRLGDLGGRRILGGIGKLTSSLAGLSGFGGLLAGGGIAAGFTLLATEGLSAGDNLAKTADKLGATTEELGRLRFAVSQTADIAQGAFDIALQRMTRRLAEAAQGGGTALKTIEELGLNAQELASNGPEKAFLTIADSISQIPDEAERVRIAFKFFDSGGVGLVNTLRNGSEGIRELGQRADSLGLSFSRVDVGKIEAANDALGRVQSVISGLALSIAVEVAPKIESLTTSFEEWIVANGGVAQIIEGAFQAVIRKAEEFKPLLAAITSLTTTAVDFVTVDETEAIAKLEKINNRITKVRSNLAESQPGNVGLVDSAIDALPFFSLETRIENSNAELEKLLAERTEIASRIDSLQLQRQSANDSFTSGPDQAIGTVQRDSAAKASQEQAAKLQEEQAENARRIQAEREKKAEAEKAAIKAAADQKANALQAERDAKALEQLRITNTARVISLRESFDERLRIQGDYNRGIAELNELESTPGLIIGDSARQEIIDGLEQQRESALSALEETKSALRNEALNLGDLLTIDVSTFTSVKDGAAAIKTALDTELSQANNIEVDITQPERQKVIAQAQSLASELNQNLQSTVTLQTRSETIQSGLSAAGSIFDSASTIFGGDDNSESISARSELITQAQSDLNDAIAAGNNQEVALQQSKLNALNAIQAKEEASQRKRLKRQKLFQAASGLASTISAGLKAFEETPGPARFAAMAATIAAGLVQVQTLKDIDIGSSSASASSASVSSTTNSVTNSDIASSANENVRSGPAQIFNFQLEPGEFLSYDQMQSFTERYNEFVGDGGTELRLTGT